jgi:hypothetical protein
MECSVSFNVLFCELKLNGRFLDQTKTIIYTQISNWPGFDSHVPGKTFHPTQIA